MKIIIPLAHITTFVLRDTILNCREDMKEDTETLFIDPLYHAGFIVQKVRPRNIIKEPVIFKVNHISYIVLTNDFNDITAMRNIER